MSGPLDRAIAALARSQRLPVGDLDAAFALIMDGAVEHDEIRAFLIGMQPFMLDPEAIAAGARALRERMVKVVAPPGAIDVCGTGGDGAHTLNISTAVAFVVAACGVPVAKHGNRAMSSRSGAADVLEALGVKLARDVPLLEACLREAGIAFLFAQAHHPAMRHVASARREIGQRTIFNLLGPLSNPAGVKRQLVGVYAPSAMEPVSRALALLGSQGALIVHGAGGLDELSYQEGGENAAWRLAGAHVAQEDLALQRAARSPAAALRGGDAAFNAQALHALLAQREPNPVYQDAVLLNAAYALALAGHAATPEDGWRKAEEALRAGAALERLEHLIALTRGAR